MTPRARWTLALPALVLGACVAPPATSNRPRTPTRLPTGAVLDPAVASDTLGSMPLGLALAPDSTHAAVVLSGSREQGVQIVDLRTGHVTQTVHRPAAFIGAVFSPDGKTLYVSGGNGDLVYRLAWDGRTITGGDSIVLAPKKTPKAPGTRYPAGLAISPDGSTLFVAENLGNALAVIDTRTGNVVQRVETARAPYAVAVAPDGTVYVSLWGEYAVATFVRPSGSGAYRFMGMIGVGRHPSAMVLNRDGSRLFVVSGSTDRVDVVDTHTRRVVAVLHDPPPSGPDEGTTPNALTLSADGTRLYVAEGDANAVAMFALSAATANVAGAAGADKLSGRVPTDWYPTALAVRRDTLVVVSGKGRGTAPNLDGPQPLTGEHMQSRGYTLSQTTGSLARVPVTAFDGATLESYTARVGRANGWDQPTFATSGYPPLQHVIYVIKENRTYDQVLGDLPVGDGDTALVFFPRAVSPNHHALAERFGVFDRFFVNAEVSADGHNWSTAAYATDYLEKTVPSEYSGRGRSYDYEGTNGGFGPKNIPDDDIAAPALGYLWDSAVRGGITYRDYGEFVVRENEDEPAAPGRYAGDKATLRGHTNPDYPGFDLTIPDQLRMDVWLREFQGFVRDGNLPALEVVRLPNDHTSGASAGRPTPRAYMADNDLALGRMVEAVSHSPYWGSTVIFVVEDDAQNGPDHVDSHRSVLLTISPYSRGGVQHRWTNTTDVLATIAAILKLPVLSQFEQYGRPLRDVFGTTPDLRPYVALRSSVPLDQKNPPRTALARASARLDLSAEDRANEDAFNRILWRAIKGDVPYPGITRMPAGPVER